MVLEINKKKDTTARGVSGVRISVVKMWAGWIFVDLCIMGEVMDGDYYD
jgi:hypothetical protein